MIKSTRTSNSLFLLLAISFSVGLGSFDRLPYLLYKYNETPFLLIYFLSSILVALPMLLVEIRLGCSSSVAFRFNLKAILPKNWGFLAFPLLVLPFFMVLFYALISMMPIYYTINAHIYLLSLKNLNHFDTIFNDVIQNHYTTYLILTCLLFMGSIVLFLHRQRARRMILSAVFLLVFIVLAIILLLTNTVLTNTIGYAITMVQHFTFSTFGFNQLSIECVKDAVCYSFYTVGAGTGIVIGLTHRFRPSPKGLLRNVFTITFINYIVSIIFALLTISMLHATGEFPTPIGLKGWFIFFPNFFFNTMDGPFLASLFFGLIAWCYLYTTTAIIIALTQVIKISYNVRINKQLYIISAGYCSIFVLLIAVAKYYNPSYTTVLAHMNNLYLFIFNILLPLSIASMCFIYGHMRYPFSYKGLYKNIPVKSKRLSQRITIGILIALRYVIPVLMIYVLTVSLFLWL